MAAIEQIGRVLARLWRADDGATAIEYALIAAGISIAIAVTVFSVGSNLNSNYFQKVLNATKST